MMVTTVMVDGGDDGAGDGVGGGDGDSDGHGDGDGLAKCTNVDSNYIFAACGVVKFLAGIWPDVRPPLQRSEPVPPCSLLWVEMG